MPVKGTKVKGSLVKRSSDVYDISLADAFEQFIEQKESEGVVASTVRNYRGSFKTFQSFIDEKDTVSEIEKNDVTRWIKAMQHDGMKHSTINHYLRDVRAFLYWCMDSSREYIKTEFKVKEVSGQEEPFKIYTKEEQKKLIDPPDDAASFVEWRTWAIVYLVLDSGSRLASIINIKKEDVQYENHQIVLTHTKNKQAQVIPMSATFETGLNKYINFWRKEAEPTAWLFCEQRQNQLSENALRLAFRRYCLNRGVSKTSIHGVRHTFATEYIKNGGNVFVLQKILGHKSIYMTMKYVKLAGADLKENFDNQSPLATLKKNVGRKPTVQRTD